MPRSMCVLTILLARLCGRPKTPISPQDLRLTSCSFGCFANQAGFSRTSSRDRFVSQMFPWWSRARGPGPQLDETAAHRTLYSVCIQRTGVGDRRGVVGIAARDQCISTVSVVGGRCLSRLKRQGLLESPEWPSAWAGRYRLAAPDAPRNPVSVPDPHHGAEAGGIFYRPVSDSAGLPRP